MAWEVKHRWLPPALMAAGVMAVYAPPALRPGQMQLAIDFVDIHQRRMAFAREALFGPAHLLPAWYPREALGTPFWSNVQSFPFLPTRLLVLLLDPRAPYTYAVAVTLAAVLAALFTWLFFRRLQLSPFAAALGGWTFACSGYFASRLAAGHLPLLEVYCGLPLLLWAADRLCEEVSAGSLLALAGAAAFVLLGGHPQLPAYALGTAALYLFVRGGFAKARWGLGALALGGACTAFVWVPMTMLIGRSTRVLGLAPAVNDVAMPVARLASFFVPWVNGAAPSLAEGRAHPFGPWPQQVFWDTHCYLGLLPWAALVALLVLRPKLERPHLFVLAVGGAALLCALPWFAEVGKLLPGTFLRSPARLLYLTGLSLSFALALAVDRLWPLKPARVALSVLALLHLLDLGWRDRAFVVARPTVPPDVEERLAAPLAGLGLGRVAIDATLPLGFAREVDDVGFEDSIILAHPYRLFADVTRSDPRQNVQVFDGSVAPAWALGRFGAHFVYTLQRRSDLPVVAREGPVTVYAVPAPGPRAAFVPLGHVRWLDDAALHRALREEGAALRDTLLLEGSGPSVTGEERAPVTLERPDPDHLVATLTAPAEGFLEVVEAYDKGWSATVDGAPAPLLPAMDAWLALRLAPGPHKVELVYRTPGRALGLGVSAAALLGLLLCAGWLRRSAGRPA